MSSAIELHGIAKLYGRTAALKAISFRLEPGQTLALLGPNGSGKTTLLKILAGAISPTLGRGSIFGRDMLTERAALRSEVGLLAGESYLYEDLSAAENLLFIMTMAGRETRREEVLRVLEEVDLGRHADERVRSFSSGMRRRTALARLLLLRPKLLLLDEPYNSLDAKGADLVDWVIRSAAEEGRAVVLATHDVERSLAVADEVIELQQGTVKYAGPAELYSHRSSYSTDVARSTSSHPGRFSRDRDFEQPLGARLSGTVLPPHDAAGHELPGPSTPDHGSTSPIMVSDEVLPPCGSDGRTRVAPTKRSPAPSHFFSLYSGRGGWGVRVVAVFRKDVLLEARSRTNINAMLFFAGIVLLIFSFALGPDPVRLRAAAAGILWLAFVFSGILAFGRSYQLEAENSAFEGLLLVAQTRSAIYGGKVLGATAVMLLVEAVILPLMAILYNVDLWTSVPALVLVGVLGTLGFASIGALYGALTMSLRAREVLLPLLLLPITVPVILGAVKATSYLLPGQHGDPGLWLELLAAFDVVFITAGLLTFEYAAGE